MLFIGEYPCSRPYAFQVFEIHIFIADEQCEDQQVAVVQSYIHKMGTDSSHSTDVQNTDSFSAFKYCDYLVRNGRWEPLFPMYQKSNIYKTVLHTAYIIIHLQINHIPLLLNFMYTYIYTD